MSRTGLMFPVLSMLSSLSLLSGACSKGPTVSGAELLDKLPAGASAVFGMTRQTSEKAILDALAQLPLAQMGAPIPKCALELYAKIEGVVVAVGVTKGDPAYSFVIRGSGLRPAIEACLKTGLPKATVVTTGRVSAYQLEAGKAVHLLWLDDHTAIGGPVNDAAATEALGKLDAPLSKDARIAEVVGKVDTKSDIWFAADVAGLPVKDGFLPKGLPAPIRAWGRLGGKGLALSATLEMAGPDDATKLADGLTKALDSAPGMAKVLTSEVKIKADGKRVVIESGSLGEIISKAAGGASVEGAGAVAVIGVLAAVAIPAFLKYTRRSKTVEGAINIKRLHDGARAYYEEEHVAQGGAPTARQFPTGKVGPTPPLGDCCKAPGHKCAPDAKLWTDPIWQALRFSVDDPSPFSYVYAGAGEGPGATFTVTAHADLDCDGVYSTFEMVGSVQADGTTAGRAGLFRDKELE